MSKVDMQVNIAGVTMNNPVVTASGTYGFGREYNEFYSLSELGGISVKGLTLAPRLGNAMPRIAETPAGILNSVGLQNPGVDSFMENDLPWLKQFSCKIFANIAGCTIEDYCEMAEKVSDGCDLIEMNISCPNVKEGGVAFGTSATMVEKITREVKLRSKIPLVVKLSPNVTDITEIARAAEAGGADALSLINTLLGMSIDIKTRRPILANNVGGMSGPAVKPVAVRMVWQVANAVKLPLIGMGGISTAEDAIEFILAGTTAISVGTANFCDPMAPVKIKEGIEEYVKSCGASSVTELVGAVKPW